MSPATVTALQPHVTVLPVRTPVNLNTASAQVIHAVIDGISLADAQRITAARASAHFRSVGDATRLLGDVEGSQPAQAFVSVASRFFEIQGRLRIGDVVVEEHTLVQREGLDVKPLRRERGVLIGGGR